jgi:hypothetical protein
VDDTQVLAKNVGFGIPGGRLYAYCTKRELSLTISPT